MPAPESDLKIPHVNTALFCKCSPCFSLEDKAKMVARVNTLAFEGIEARPVDVQIQIYGGRVDFTIVGLGDKAVGEPRALGAERLGPVDAG